MRRTARPRRRLAALFAGMGAASAGVIGLALWLGLRRAEAAGAADGLATAAVVSLFGVAGVLVGAWLALDERAAKPVERIAARLRLGASGCVPDARPDAAAPDLGDLAPAAEAAVRRLAGGDRAVAGHVASATERLSAERDALAALLSQIPLAVLMVGADDRILLYDGQAAEVLEQVGPPRLDAPITDYFDAAAVADGKRRAAAAGAAVAVDLRTRGGALRLGARMAALEGGAHLLVVERAAAGLARGAARPLVHGLGHAAPRADGPLDARRLRELSYAVVDLETTGLLPHADAIVQVGAVRLRGGGLVPGETLDLLIHPGRPIPPAATAVHGIDDDAVADAPAAAAVLPRLHAFCEGCVFVAHNAPFDLAFLRRHAAASPTRWSFPTLDTVLLSAIVFGASETHTLDALAGRLGLAVVPDQRHSAIGDARLTAEVLARLLPILEARGLNTFGAVVGEARRHGRMLRDMNRP